MTAFLKLIFKVDLQPILDESGHVGFVLIKQVLQTRKTKLVSKKDKSKKYINYCCHIDKDFQRG